MRERRVVRGTASLEVLAEEAGVPLSVEGPAQAASISASVPLEQAAWANVVVVAGMAAWLVMVQLGHTLRPVATDVAVGKEAAKAAATAEAVAVMVAAVAGAVVKSSACHNLGNLHREHTSCKTPRYHRRHIHRQS